MFEFVQLFFKKKGMTTPVAATQRVVYDTIQHIGNWVASFFSRYMTAVGKEVRYVVFARMGSL